MILTDLCLFLADQCKEDYLTVQKGLLLHLSYNVLVPKQWD